MVKLDYLLIIYLLVQVYVLKLFNILLKKYKPIINNLYIDHFELETVYKITSN